MYEQTLSAISLHWPLSSCHKKEMLSALAWNRPLGRLARLPLRLLPATLAVPVLSGPNRGMRWVIGAGNHSCWRGTYEGDRLLHVCRVVRPGAMVFDVGAHAGYYTLALSRTVGALGSVLAFEPDAGNLARLKRHLAINHIGNVQVIEAAVLDQAGSVPFQSDRRGYLSHVAEEGELVRAVCLDDFGWPDVIKMDVEGFEAKALCGAESILKRGHAHIFLSLHGICDQEALAILVAHRYEIRWFDERELHAIPPN